ncbi:histidine N-acetyltransferase isoform X1 [Nerophis lumbriciformis]|uniref:histidine N-acetyltransferase isoform X1 n=2 Tax=Nerophis lumbriciformis TaxID=546530 RepID=UPI002AE071CD|nr:histidine N-acetyltransferase isoform X1 [Nerophis lumbriciformis]XP_061815377.1 histidine N-acetyltransferase isoform X1 [Nerophis lumbriciformis]XP_061815379.1 histidine N-acetyltransferase isoform X1 [Nerophis lumbriciformis]XP_061815965.1 histidine N-acetyltransferase isoform X1 [Nerophis lumbriciformis]XP_061815966.1 histidine N-acetyltransferase isoform X1 [Nerophis lumbriciformis]XP_061815967.1 histidine N-acetyltransferase isoform X1 [Nerophis lumbriciformis]XP_061815969.1 histidin
MFSAPYQQDNLLKTCCFMMKIDTSLITAQLPEALSQAGLQFTVATEEDFDDIMAMSQDIYGGLDYLPTRYTSWLQESNRTVILARKQGKVIALESVCVIDNGQTMLVEGLRVAPQERGKGVAGVLLRFCSELVKSKYPEVKVSRLTRDDQLRPKDFQKYRIITKQGILLMRFQAEDLKLRLSDLGGQMQAPLSSFFSNGPPIRLDNNAIYQLYLTTDLMRGVLPNATIIQDWQPFKLLPTNMAILMKKDIDWMVDDASNPTVGSLCTFPFRVPIGDDWYYLNIDMFGKDLDLVRQQFLCHLQRHTATLKGHVMCQMFLDPPLWKPMADFCRDTLSVELVKEYTEQCVVESDVM